MKLIVRRGIQVVFGPVVKKINIFRWNKEKEYHFFGIKATKKNLYLWLSSKLEMPVQKYLLLYTSMIIPIEFISVSHSMPRINFFIEQVNSSMPESDQSKLIEMLSRAVAEGTELRVIVDDYKINYEWFRQFLLENNLSLPSDITFYMRRNDCFGWKSYYYLEVCKDKDLFVVECRSDLLSLKNVHDVTCEAFGGANNQNFTNTQLSKINKRDNLDFKDESIKIIDHCIIASQEQVKMLLVYLEDWGIPSVKTNKVKVINSKVKYFKVGKVKFDVINENSELSQSNWTEITISDFLRKYR